MCDMLFNLDLLDIDGKDGNLADMFLIQLLSDCEIDEDETPDF